MIRLPTGAPPQLRCGYRAAAGLTAPLWAMTIAGIWMPWDDRAQGVLRAAAAAAIIIAAMCWAACWVHDGQVRSLIRQNGDLWRRIPEQDRPPLLESVR